jgi:hypothetical protein
MSQLAVTAIVDNAESRGIHRTLGKCGPGINWRFKGFTLLPQFLSADITSLNPEAVLGSTNDDQDSFT